MAEPGDREGERAKLELVEATHRGIQQQACSSEIIMEANTKVVWMKGDRQMILTNDEGLPGVLSLNSGINTNIDGL